MENLKPTESFVDKARALIDLKTQLQEVNDKTSSLVQDIVLSSEQTLEIRKALFALQDCEQKTKAFSQFEQASKETQLDAAQTLWSAVYVELDEHRREQVGAGAKLIQWLKGQPRHRPAISSAMVA